MLRRHPFLAFVVAGLLACVSPALAEEPAAENPAQPLAAPSEVFAPLEADDLPDWFTMAEVSLLQPTLESGDASIRRSLDWTASPSVELARKIGAWRNDGGAWLGLTYRYLQADGSSAFPAANLARRRDELTIHTLDAGFHSWSPGATWDVEVRGCLRYAHLATDTDLTGRAGRLGERSQFNGGGFLFGVSGQRKLGDSAFRFLLGLDGSLLYGSVSQTNASSRGRWANDFNLRTGLSWSPTAGWLRLTTGYQIEGWSHVVQLPVAEAPLNPTTGTNDVLIDRNDLFLHGPFLRCEIHY